MCWKKFHLFLNMILYTNHVMFTNSNNFNDRWHYVNSSSTLVSGCSRKVKYRYQRKIPNIVKSHNFPALFFPEKLKGKVALFFFLDILKCSWHFFFNLPRAFFWFQEHFTWKCCGQQKKCKRENCQKMLRTIFGLTGSIFIFCPGWYSTGNIFLSF